MRQPQYPVRSIPVARTMKLNDPLPVHTKPEDILCNSRFTHNSCPEIDNAIFKNVL